MTRIIFAALMVATASIVFIGWNTPKHESRITAELGDRDCQSISHEAIVYKRSRKCDWENLP
jgi:hypothetical protein